VRALRYRVKRLDTLRPPPKDDNWVNDPKQRLAWCLENGIDPSWTIIGGPSGVVLLPPQTDD
jgi:hypothetical protein